MLEKCVRDYSEHILKRKCISANIKPVCGKQFVLQTRQRLYRQCQHI
jgi:hypothetical protein